MKKNTGFTLIEIAIVLLIVSILLGYTVAMAPRQQELKQFKQAKSQLNDIQDALYAFAQVNGYLPCPAWEDATNSSNGFECRGDGAGSNCEGGLPETVSCDVWTGFVPAKTLGIDGKYSDTGFLLDPWGSKYGYQVTDDDDDGDNKEDFVMKNEIKDVGMADLTPDLIVCNTETTNATSCDDASESVIESAPVIIWSTGKNREATTLQNENTDGDLVYISTVFSDNFDDLVKWISPNILYSKMIEAGQLP